MKMHLSILVIQSTVEMFQSNLPARLYPTSTYSVHMLSSSHTILDRFLPTPGWLHLLVSTRTRTQQTHCVIGHGCAGAWLPQAAVCHRHTATELPVILPPPLFVFAFWISD